MSQQHFFVMAAAFISIVLLMVARHHPPSRRKIKEIWHGRVYWEGNTTMLRSTALEVVDTATGSELTVTPPEVTDTDTVTPPEVLKSQPDNHKASNAMIPKIIHQYWNGAHPPKGLMQHCRDLHPDWEYHLWTPENVGEIPDFHNEDIFNAFSHQQVNDQSDILRFEVLRTYGGIYLDADTVCFRSLEPLRKNGFFAGYHNFDNPGIPHRKNKNIASAVIGSVKNHPLAVELVHVLGNNQKHARGPAWKNVGPGLLTRVVTDCTICNATGDIHIYPYWAFVPYHFREKSVLTSYIHRLWELPRVKKYNSYCMNLWGTTFNAWKSLQNIITPPNVIVSNAIDDKKPDTKPPKSNFCKSYPSIYSGQLYEESLDIILHIQKVLSAAKMEWSIAFGTSLGWKRGNTFTPYDDDMDIVIKKRDSKPFRQLFKPPFCTATFWGGLKVFKCSRPSAGKYKWKTPFVDVWDGTHMSSKWKYEDSFMFPTRPTVFAGYIVQVSKNIEKHLAIKYPTPDNCTTLTWNHIKEQRKKEKRQTHPCSEVQKQCFSDKIDVYRYPPLITNSSKRQEILYDMLQWFDNIASKYDIKYSLVYGTLLGWRREGHIISKDTDLDVQIGSVGISKLVHLIDTGIAKAASEHGGINTNKITLLVRKTHDRLFSDVQRTNCKGEPVSRMVDGCAFSGPIARVMFKGKHVDIYFRCSHLTSVPSSWHCKGRIHSGCSYCQSRDSVPLPEVYPCRLGPVDTYCFGPDIVKRDLNEIYSDWMIIK
jgi:mannosyltransferase OCH1-like enzyme